MKRHPQPSDLGARVLIRETISPHCPFCDVTILRFSESNSHFQCQFNSFVDSATEWYSVEKYEIIDVISVTPSLKIEDCIVKLLPPLDPITLTKDEQLIVEAILDGRKVQEYLWQELSLLRAPYNPLIWNSIFQKRVNKIREIDPSHPNHKVVLRKRVLQQAALSILALRILDEEIKPTDNEGD